jgi:hypothetical protein
MLHPPPGKLRHGGRPGKHSSDLRHVQDVQLCYTLHIRIILNTWIINTSRPLCRKHNFFPPRKVKFVFTCATCFHWEEMWYASVNVCRVKFVFFTCTYAYKFHSWQTSMDEIYALLGGCPPGELTCYLIASLNGNGTQVKLVNNCTNIYRNNHTLSAW